MEEREIEPAYFLTESGNVVTVEVMNRRFEVAPGHWRNGLSTYRFEGRPCTRQDDGSLIVEGTKQRLRPAPSRA